MEENASILVRNGRLEYSVWSDIFNVNLIFLSVFDILVYLTFVELILSFT